MGPRVIEQCGRTLKIIFGNGGANVVTIPATAQYGASKAAASVMILACFMQFKCNAAVGQPVFAGCLLVVCSKHAKAAGKTDCPTLRHRFEGLQLCGQGGSFQTQHLRGRGLIPIRAAQRLTQNLPFDSSDGLLKIEFSRGNGNRPLRARANRLSRNGPTRSEIRGR